MQYILFLFLTIFTNLVFANDNHIDICSLKNSIKYSVNANLELCNSDKGITIKHHDNKYNYKFINHIETQFYIINSLPSGFLCRDGIFSGRKLPSPKYEPNNGIYLYKLRNIRNKLEPFTPAKPKIFKIREYIMNYSSLDRRKLQALALVKYNGNKNINSGSIILFPKDKDKILKFEISKCRIKMTEAAKKINKFTMKRR